MYPPREQVAPSLEALQRCHPMTQDRSHQATCPYPPSGSSSGEELLRPTLPGLAAMVSKRQPRRVLPLRLLVTIYLGPADSLALAAKFGRPGRERVAPNVGCRQAAYP